MIEMIIYMAGIIIMMIAFAIRTSNTDIAPALILSVFWPLSILVMIIIKGLWIIKWDIDIVGVNKWFGYRKSTNPKVRGFAIIIFKLEFQLWQKRKI
jgi:hypothetical protein